MASSDILQSGSLSGDALITKCAYPISVTIAKPPDPAAKRAPCTPRPSSESVHAAPVWGTQHQGNRDGNYSSVARWMLE